MSASLRDLLGLAPGGRIAVLESLLAGSSSLEDLIRVSALPRRDVEEFTAALDGLDGDHGKLLADYQASRVVVRPDDEAELTCVAESLIAGAPAPLKRLDHVQATAETLVRRVRWLTDTFDLRGRSVLFVGDHDVTSLLLARVMPEAASPEDGVTLTVADIDERLLAYVGEASGGRVRGASGAQVHGASGARVRGASGARVRGLWTDFRFGLPPSVAASADVIVTDPPYTPEGLGLFLSRSVEALRRDEADARIVIAYGHSRRRPDLGVAAQREIIRQDVAIDAMLPAFSAYDGAQAVGSASDWYSLQPTAKAFRRLDSAARQGGPPGIYTHGEQSVESSAANPADLIPLLSRLSSSGPGNPGVAPGATSPGGTSGAGDAVAGHASGTGDRSRVGLVAPDPGEASGFAAAVSLGKLLADGVHPSVTGRASEFVVDLRDDPGPWLVRAMLALNAPRAVFVVNARHDALTRLASWDLIRAKYTSVSAHALGDLTAALGDLAAVRCELAPDESDDPAVALSRFVARRAHGKLRNVWREALVQVSGGTVTKREAAARADTAAASAGLTADLSLRLVDVPAARFPALYTALRTSA